MEHLNTKRKLHYIGAAVWEGQTKPGVDKGPDAFREANLFKALERYNTTVEDHGNISIKNVDPKDIKEENKGQIDRVEVLDPLLFELHKTVKKAAEKKDGFVCTVGGDHSIATGTISALKTVHEDLKVIWIDAHPDAIKPDMSSYDHYHGMPASHLMGWITQDEIKGFHWLDNCKIKNEDIVYIGVRDIDDDEKINLKKKGIKCFTPDHILKHGGIGPVMEKALSYLDPENKGLPIHVSLDIDGLDPSIAPGTGTKAHGGLNYREAHYIMRCLAQRGNFVGLDMVEVNPELDPKEKKEKIFGDDPILDATQTVFLGCDLILSCMGRTNLFLED